MFQQPVDLSTVAGIHVNGRWHAVKKGTFRVGEPVFTQPSEDGQLTEYYGGRWHPLSYFFTDIDDRHYTGPYDAISSIRYSAPAQPEPKPEDPTTPDALLGSLLRTFQRTWSCSVFDSGRHNGVHCTEGDPHEGWGCGYRWKFPPMTDTEARRFGLTTDSTKDDG